MTRTDTEWWKSFHLPEMGDVLLERTEEQLSTTLDFLRRELVLKPGVRVFDQCCGIGSLSIPIAREGVRVTGCDLFEPYVARARHDAEDLPEGAAEFFCADAFEFLPEHSCDAVFNWYSSFGYADDDEINRRMLDRAFEALKPGGRFAMDVPSVPGILRNFNPVMIQEGNSKGRAVRIERTSEIEFSSGLLKQTWRWEIEGEDPVERKSAMKLYLPNRIAELLTRSGFEKVQLLGDTDGVGYGMDSRRLIVLAERPK